MNYIKRLESENSELKEKIKNADDFIAELFYYLSLEKFQHGDLAGYVNINDVRSRLQLVRNEL